MKKIFLVSIALFILILVMGFVSAAPPAGTPVSQTQVSSSTIEIAYPKYGYVPQNSEFDLHAHVINATSPLTNTTTSCFLHLYYPNGQHSMRQNMSYGENIALGEFEVNVNANNFSQLGTHAYIIECFTYNEVGFVSGEFEVTPSGSFIDTQESILIIGSLFLMIVISSIFFIIAYKSDKIVLKTSFFVASAIFFTATLLYMVIALQQSLWNIPAVLVGAESFWFMIRMLLTIGFVSLMILIALLLLKSWRIKRGLLDE